MADPGKLSEDRSSSRFSMRKKKARKAKIPEVKLRVDKQDYHVTVQVLSHDTGHSAEAPEVLLRHASFALRTA